MFAALKNTESCRTYPQNRCSMKTELWFVFPPVLQSILGPEKEVMVYSHNHSTSLPPSCLPLIHIPSCYSLIFFYWVLRFQMLE